MDDLIRYVSELQATLRSLPMDRVEQVIQALQDARLAGRLIYIMGNGGSASTASHFVCDLAKNTRREDWPPFRVVGLADNMAILSAYANDEGYDKVFAQQLASLVVPDDVVIMISASGNSPNVLRAAELARQRGATTVGFTGFDGGKLGSLVDIHVHVASRRIEHVEDIHLMLEHMITARLRDEVGQELITWELSSEPADGFSPLTSLRLAGPSGAELAVLAQPALSQVETDEPVTPAGLLRRILPLATQCVNCPSGCTILVDEHGKVDHGLLVYKGELREAPRHQLTETVERGLAGWVVQNRQPVLIQDTLEDPRWLQRSDLNSGQESRSAICVPLQDGERILGALTLVCPGPNRFSETDLAVVMALATSISKVASEARRVGTAAPR